MCSAWVASVPGISTHNGNCSFCTLESSGKLNFISISEASLIISQFYVDKNLGHNRYRMSLHMAQCWKTDVQSNTKIHQEEKLCAKRKIGQMVTSFWNEAVVTTGSLVLILLEWRHETHLLENRGCIRGLFWFSTKLKCGQTNCAPTNSVFLHESYQVCFS